MAGSIPQEEVMTALSHASTAIARRSRGVAAFAVSLAVALGMAFAPVPARSADDSTAYGRLLAKHVRPGTVEGIRLNLVDYAALAKDPDYAQAIADLEGATPDALETRDEQFAFWANAYNLVAIKTVVDHYPIDSIRDGGTFFSPIWKKKTGTVAGKEYSLDEIEHGVLRMDFKEPRMHFAVVCASLSCPDLRAEPYAGDKLDAQLDEQARSFLSNQTKGMVPGKDGKTAKVSSIFKWFANDFDRVGGVAVFVKAKADPAVAAKVGDLTDSGLSYLDYDWSLNDTKRMAR
jgi:Protein of unknown function, DUF547